jgi:hypothetical protein
MSYLFRPVVLAAAAVSLAACANPVSPGNQARQDPGTVVVQVRDTAGAPVPNVWVYIELPNSVGSTFWEGTPTRSDGSVTMRYIPAGRRTVEVKPPAGFAADAPKHEIDVRKDATVTTRFELRRL